MIDTVRPAARKTEAPAADSERGRPEQQPPPAPEPVHVPSPDLPVPVESPHSPPLRSGDDPLRSAPGAASGSIDDDRRRDQTHHEVSASPILHAAVPEHRRASSLEKLEQALTDLFHRARQKEPAVLPDDFWLDVHELVGMVPEDPGGFLMHVFEVGPDDPEWPLEHHAINVGILCILVGHHLKMDDHDLRDLAAGALVHDLGLAPLKRLTEQNRRLTERERRLINLHAYEGERLFSDANKGFETIQLIVRQSQERENGTGSPEKISADAIHPLTKIVAACDALESLTHHRPYRPISTPRTAFQKLLDEKEKYAPHVLKAMLSCITPYPPGSIVHLSTGVRARVRRVNAGSCLRPLVTPIGPGRHEGIDLDLMHLPHVWVHETKAD